MLRIHTTADICEAIVLWTQYIFRMQKQRRIQHLLLKLASERRMYVGM